MDSSPNIRSSNNAIFDCYIAAAFALGVAETHEVGSLHNRILDSDIENLLDIAPLGYFFGDVPVYLSEETGQIFWIVAECSDFNHVHVFYDTEFDHHVLLRNFCPSIIPRFKILCTSKRTDMPDIVELDYTLEDLQLSLCIKISGD